MSSLHDKYGPDAPRILSGMMLDKAEEVPIPARFQVKTGSEPNGVVILDTETGRTTSVPLASYRAVRQTLQDLFGV